MKKEYARVIDILGHPSHSLKELAEASGRDIFTFYRGASLVGLDLSHQDLTGLNFERADLRFSQMLQIKYDEGAFNGSVLDSSQDKLRDPYAYYAEDVVDFPNHKILVFVRLRHGLIDKLIHLTQLSYTEASDGAGVGINTLRKARRSQVVSTESAQKLLKFFGDLAVKGDNMISLMKQPVAQFLEGGSNGKFTSVSRTRMTSLIRLKSELPGLRGIKASEMHEYRDTPMMIEWSHRYHSNRLESEAKTEAEIAAMLEDMPQRPMSDY